MYVRMGVVIYGSRIAVVESSTEHAWPSDDVVSVADPIGIGNQSTDADAVAIHDEPVANGEAFVVEFDTSKVKTAR